MIAVAAGILATVAVLAWFVKTRSGPKKLGLSTEGLRPTLLLLAGPTLGGVAAMVLVTLASGRGLGDLTPSLRVLRTFLLYPVWACAQQLFVLAFVQRRVGEGGFSRGAAIAYAALALAALHLPNLPLALGTGLLGLLWGYCWAHYGNLLGIALSHGILGAVADEVLDMDLHVGLHYWERLLPPT